MVQSENRKTFIRLDAVLVGAETGIGTGKQT
jgi:hypothetical protein